MISRKLLTAFALSLLILMTGAAQTSSSLPESKEEKEKARKELERKALALLNETLDSAPGLKLAENRALVQAQAADLLWTREEKRARALFRDAMTGAGEALQSAGAQSSRRDMSYWMLVQSRSQTLQMIAARDPQLALDLLRATRPASQENTESDENFGMGNQELRLEQSIAAQVAESDPKRALQIAQESLNKGITFGLINVLQRLQQKDAEAATRLAGDIVKKLQADNLTTNQEGSFTAMELLRSVLSPQTQPNTSGMRSSVQATEKIKPLSLDDQTIRELAGVVVNAALKSPLGGPGLLMQLQPVLPELEKRIPERAPQLRRKIGEMNQSLDPQAKAWMQFESLSRGGSTDAVLDAAAKAPAEVRGGLYSMAAMRLLQTGEMERARQVITQNLSGTERDQLLALIDRAAITRVLEQGKLDEAKQLVSRIRAKERRASALAQLAAGVAAKGDRKVALSLLDEARGLIDRQPDNQKEIEASLEVARGYALVDPARAFELLDPLINQANEMLAAAALLEKFGSGPGLFRKGEMVLQPGFAGGGALYGQYVKALAELARADFERTKSAADKFGRDEVRLMARLLIAQSVLSDRPGASDAPYVEGIFGMSGGILIGH
jgi:hypothetical protein